MRQFSKKRAKRNRDCKQLRKQLIQDYGFCLCCDASYGPVPTFLAHLCCHEIAGGIHREAFLDQPCGILVVCASCNTGPLEDHSLWPWARQLALLKHHGGAHYDLGRWNGIISREAVTEEEVESWREVLYPGEGRMPCEGCPPLAG